MSDFDNLAEQLPGATWETYMEYHSGQHDPNGADMDRLPTINTPYLLASYMNGLIVRRVEESGYPANMDTRHDMAVDIANEWYNDPDFQKDYSPADVAFEALNHWRRIFRGHHG